MPSSTCLLLTTFPSYQWTLSQVCIAIFFQISYIYRSEYANIRCPTLVYLPPLLSYFCYLIHHIPCKWDLKWAMGLSLFSSTPTFSWLPWKQCHLWAICDSISLLLPKEMQSQIPGVNSQNLLWAFVVWKNALGASLKYYLEWALRVGAGYLQMSSHILTTFLYLSSKHYEGVGGR